VKIILYLLLGQLSISEDKNPRFHNYSYFLKIKGVELLIDLNASSISLGLFKKFVLHSCSKSNVLVLNGCADNIHTFSLFFIFLFISLDNFPIFLEYEFNLLSFNKNLFSILTLDSNS